MKIISLILQHITNYYNNSIDKIDIRKMTLILKNYVMSSILPIFDSNKPIETLRLLEVQS